MAAGDLPCSGWVRVLVIMGFVRVWVLVIMAHDVAPV
jgi:hypothetical protein